MFTITAKNEVVFEKGHKPRSIKDAQRDVKEVYRTLCSENAPQSTAIAKAIFMSKLGSQWQAILEDCPTMADSIMTAARAYTASGPALLANPNLHCMNVLLSVAALQKLPDLSPALLEALIATGITEFMFVAREMKDGVVPAPKKTLGQSRGSGASFRSSIPNSKY